jgi:addiction module HigA family antidote
MPRTPIHPGEHLKDELDVLGVSASELARQLRIPANRLTAIIAGDRAITAETAVFLGHWFGTSPVFWLNLQMQHDLRLAEKAIGKSLKALPTRARQAA